MSAPDQSRAREQARKLIEQGVASGFHEATLMRALLAARRAGREERTRGVATNCYRCGKEIAGDRWMTITLCSDVTCIRAHTDPAGVVSPARPQAAAAQGNPSEAPKSSTPGAWPEDEGDIDMTLEGIGFDKGWMARDRRANGESERATRAAFAEAARLARELALSCYERRDRAAKSKSLQLAQYYDGSGTALQQHAGELDALAAGGKEQRTEASSMDRAPGIGALERPDDAGSSPAPPSVASTARDAAMVERAREYSDKNDIADGFVPHLIDFAASECAEIWARYREQCELTQEMRSNAEVYKAECASRDREIASLREENEKWRTAAGVLCGAHVGQAQPQCPVCRYEEYGRRIVKLTREGYEARASLARAREERWNEAIEDAARRLEMVTWPGESPEEYSRGYVQGERFAAAFIRSLLRVAEEQRQGAEAVSGGANLGSVQAGSTPAPGAPTPRQDATLWQLAEDIDSLYPGFSHSEEVLEILKEFHAHPAPNPQPAAIDPAATGSDRAPGGSRASEPRP